VDSILGTGLSGLRTIMQKMRSAANNAANVNTPGYKATRVGSRDISTAAAKSGRTTQIRGGAAAAGVTRDMSQGALQQTNNPLDMAIDGIGFFRMLQPDGSEVYTRNGSFRRAEDGRLVSSDGLSLNPQVNIPRKAASVSVSFDGGVRAWFKDRQQPQTVGRISLATFRNPRGLRATGQNRFAATAGSGNAITGRPGQAGFGRIRSGYLESSNVNLLDTQVNLIEQFRSFQANARTIRTGDDLSGTIINLKR